MEDQVYVERKTIMSRNTLSQNIPTPVKGQYQIDEILEKFSNVIDRTEGLEKLLEQRLDRVRLDTKTVNPVVTDNSGVQLVPLGIQLDSLMVRVKNISDNLEQLLDELQL